MNYTERIFFIKKNRDKNMSYKNIGMLLGISWQRVHQIHTKYTSPSHKQLPAEKLTIWNKRKRKSLNLAEEINRYSGGRDFIRELVRLRDNHACQKCGKKWVDGERRLDVHHLDIEVENLGSSSRGSVKRDKENFNKMITLCHKCHLNLPSVKDKMKYRYKK
jgi:5-methylcytosine-specific restriction endonuclease McrA